MDKLTAIKIKYDDGTYSDEIPVSVLSENVEWDSTHTLVDVLGSIDVDVTGTIQDQISQLFNEKVSASALNNYVANQLNEDVVNWLNTYVNPVGSAVVVDSSLSIAGAAADAKVTGEKIDLTLKNYDVLNAISNYVVAVEKNVEGKFYKDNFTLWEDFGEGTFGFETSIHKDNTTKNYHAYGLTFTDPCKIYSTKAVAISLHGPNRDTPLMYRNWGNYDPVPSTEETAINILAKDTVYVTFNIATLKSNYNTFLTSYYIANLKDNVDITLKQKEYIDNKFFTIIDQEYNIDKNFSEMTAIQEMTGFVQWNGSFVQATGYHTYYYEINENTNVFFKDPIVVDDITFNHYLSIAIFDSIENINTLQGILYYQRNTHNAASQTYKLPTTPVSLNTGNIVALSMQTVGLQQYALLTSSASLYLNNNVILRTNHINTVLNNIINTVEYDKNLNQNDYYEINTNTYIPTNGVPTALNGYTTRWFIFDTDKKLYISDEVTSTSPYFSIAVYSSVDSKGTSAGLIFWGRHNDETRHPLPRQDNPLVILANQPIGITGNLQNYVFINDKRETLKENILLSEKAIQDIQSQLYLKKKPYVIYKNNTLNIYMPMTYGYVRYDFNHYVNASTNADGWGIYLAWATNNDFIDLYQITTSGEWEAAIHLTDSPDFSGLRAHGSEIYSEIKVFVDNQYFNDPTDITELTEFNELRIFEKSKFYSPRDEVTEIADHYKEYIWKDNKLVINQKIVWLVNDTLTSSYLAMFPIAKTVTNQFVDRTGWKYKDISSGSPSYNSNNCTSVMLYGTELNHNIRAIFSILNYDAAGTQYKTFGLTDNGGGAYNKCYYHIKDNGTVNINEEWHTTTEYQFFINE